MLVSVISVHFCSPVSINHSSPVVSWMFMRWLHETNGLATGEQCMCRSVSFVLEVPTQRLRPFARAPLLIGKLLNNSAV